jgi:MFS family permease
MRTEAEGSVAIGDEASRAGVGVRAWASLALLIVFYVLAYADRQLISLLVQPLKRGLHLSDLQIGLLQGAGFSLFYVTAGLPIGYLADRWSRPLIVLGGVILWSLAAMSCGLASSFGQLFAGRAAVGVGEATLTPTSFSLVSDLFPRERLATALGIYSMGSNIGSGVSYAIGGILVGALGERRGLVLPIVGHMATWQAAFVIVGAPGLVFALAALFLKDPRRGRASAADNASWDEFRRMLIKRRGVAAAQFTAFPSLGVIAYAIGAWAPTYFTRRFGWGPELIGPLLGAQNIVLGGAAAVVGGVLVDRVFRAGVLHAHFLVPAITATIGAPLCILAFLAHSAWPAFVALVAGSTLLNSFGGASFSAIQLIAPPRMRGRLSALYVFILSGVGLTLGPFLVGAFTDHLFHSEAEVGPALALVVAIFAPLAVGGLLLGRRALTAALADDD